MRAPALTGCRLIQLPEGWADAWAARHPSLDSRGPADSLHVRLPGRADRARTRSSLRRPACSTQPVLELPPSTLLDSREHRRARGLGLASSCTPSSSAEWRARAAYRVAATIQPREHPCPRRHRSRRSSLRRLRQPHNRSSSCGADDHPEPDRVPADPVPAPSGASASNRSARGRGPRLPLEPPIAAGRPGRNSCASGRSRSPLRLSPLGVVTQMASPAESRV